MRSAFLIKDGVGGWIGEEPTLAGCTVKGKTLSEALTKLTDAVQSALDQLRADGQPIPPIWESDSIRGTPILLKLRDDVIEAVRQTFPAEEPPTILALLDDYGKARLEIDRNNVKLAILGLSKGDASKLLSLITMAKRDYRNVLAAYQIDQAKKKKSAQ